MGLASRFDLVRVDRYSSLVDWTFKLHDAIDERVNGVVSTDTDAWTRVELGSALSHDDAAWLHHFSAVLLNSQSLRIRIATVS